MSNDGNQVLLGRLAVHKKLITMEQLVEATTEQGRFGNEHQRLGEVLVQKGFLSRAQLDQLLALQRAFLTELSTHAGVPADGEKPAAKKPAPPAARSAAPAQGAPATRPAPAAPSRPAPPAAAAPLDPRVSAPSFGVHPSSGHSAFAQAPQAPAAAEPPSPLSLADASGDSFELDLDRSGARSWSTEEGAPAAAAPPAPPPPPTPPPPVAAEPPSFVLDFNLGPSPSVPLPAVPVPGAPDLVVGQLEEAPPLKLELSLPPEPEPEVAELVLDEIMSDEVPREEREESEESEAALKKQSGSGPSLTALSEDPGRAERLDALLERAAREGASDVHLHPGSPPKARLSGVLVDMDPAALDASVVESMLLEAMNPAQRTLLAEAGQLDLAYAIDNVGRFRANIYRGLTGMNGVFRFVPAFVPSLVQLGLPTELSKLTTFHQGLVLVTGPAGCGKSTTLASLVNIINEERNDHVLTIEDPIEYLHPSKRCLVNQRQVSRHTGSFARALRAALREDPDVIVIGELRDLETISLALTAAETGHLVLGTLHTNSAIRTINRIVGAFPPNEQAQIRSMLSESLRAILSQRLLARKEGPGRVSALEVLHVNKAVANTIRENKTFQLRSMMQTGRTQGQLLLDQSLQDLVRADIVSKEEAARHVEDPRFLQ